MNVIELQQNEVHTKEANIEETVSRLDSEVQVLKFRTTKLEKNVEELEEGLRDLQCGNNKRKNEVYDLKEQLLYMETYSRRQIFLNSLAYEIISNARSPWKKDQSSESCLRTLKKLFTYFWKRN